MDLKEGAKWIGVLVVGGLISSLLKIALTRYISGVATAAAHETVRRMDGVGATPG